jgi:hypothetical protein
MLESLNTGKVYEKGKGYFSFYIDSFWLSYCRMSGKLYQGCSGRDGGTIILLLADGNCGSVEKIKGSS